MEQALKRVFTAYSVKPQHQASIIGYLSMLRARDAESYRHSIRVGMLAARIASECEIAGIEPKALLWAGLLHDIGKALVDPRLFKKGVIFTKAEQQEMEPHVEYGWRLLRGIHDYTAHIIVGHHRFGSRPYPTALPTLPAHLASERESIETSSRLLALADYYDAIMKRENEKFGAPLTIKQKREKYLEENADQKSLVLLLEQKGVLTFAQQ